jgi:hypothetical protein
LLLYSVTHLPLKKTRLINFPALLGKTIGKTYNECFYVM